MSVGNQEKAAQVEPTIDHELPLNQVIKCLDSFESIIDLDQLKSILARLQVDDPELQDFKRFSADGYQRNLIARSDTFEALLLCFEPGQRTPIHDHAGSACGVRVIEGVASETIFESTQDGWLYATTTEHLGAPGVVGSQDMDIHQLSNLQAHGRRLVTLHVYSPPLGEVGNYRVEDNSKTLVQAPTRDASGN